MHIRFLKSFGILTLVLFAHEVSGQRTATPNELAQQVSNPIASLTNAPFQFNYDANIGPDDDGSMWTRGVQPVVPFDLGSVEVLNSRTILPCKCSDEVRLGDSSDFGAVDIDQGFFLFPKAATSGGWIWGAGLVILIHTSDELRYGAGEWRIGATALTLKQSGGRTYGGLMNHFVDASGDLNIKSTVLQPFFSNTIADA